SHDAVWMLNAPSGIYTYPDAVQFTVREAYLRGFLVPVDNGSGPAQITIGGKTAPQDDGAFGLTVSKDDLGLTTDDDAKPWSVEVKAIYPDGQAVITKVGLKVQVASPESTDAHLLPT